MSTIIACICMIGGYLLVTILGWVIGYSIWVIIHQLQKQLRK